MLRGKAHTIHAFRGPASPPLRHPLPLHPWLLPFPALKAVHSVLALGLLSLLSFSAGPTSLCSSDLNPNHATFRKPSLIFPGRAR